MISLKQMALVAMCLGLISCHQTNPVEPIEGADITVTATELDSGRWQVDFLLQEPAQTLIFSRSNGDYRRQTWTPRKDAAPIERVGDFDSLSFDNPVRAFSYEVEPYTQGIPQDYTPFLAFSDGGVAIFTGQFELLHVADRAAIEALEGDLTRWEGQQPTTGIRIRSERPILVQGQPAEGQVEHVSVGGGTYVYVGDAELQLGDSYVGVIDSALPDHIRESLDADLTAIFGEFENLWGFALPTRGTIYFAFEGYDHPGVSNKGSVIGTDLMVLQASGEGLKEPDPAYRVRNLWFFAHEGAHMFQSKVMERFAVGPDAWIHEGGANAMGNSVIQGLPGVPEQFIQNEYQTAFDKCLSDLESGSLKTAHVDGRFYAHYHCGQLFSAATDAALPEHDLYDFWKSFAAELDPDDYQPAEAYFSTFEKLGGNAEVGDLIKQLAYEDQDDPRALLVALLEKSGMAPSFDDAGRLSSLSIPL